MKSNESTTLIPTSDREHGPDCVSWCENGADLCDGKNCGEMGLSIETSSFGGPGLLTVSRTLKNTEHRVDICYSGRDLDGSEVEVEFFFTRSEAEQLMLNLIRAFAGIPSAVDKVEQTEAGR
jgi:hypothetical protein